MRISNKPFRQPLSLFNLVEESVRNRISFWCESSSIELQPSRLNFFNLFFLFGLGGGTGGESSRYSFSSIFSKTSMTLWSYEEVYKDIKGLVNNNCLLPFHINIACPYHINIGTTGSTINNLKFFIITVDHTVCRGAEMDQLVALQCQLSAKTFLLVFLAFLGACHNQ